MCDMVSAGVNAECLRSRSLPGFVSSAGEGDETNVAVRGRVPVVMNPASYRQAHGDGPPGWGLPGRCPVGGGGRGRPAAVLIHDRISPVLVFSARGGLDTEGTRER